MYIISSTFIWKTHHSYQVASFAPVIALIACPKLYQHFKITFMIPKEIFMRRMSDLKASLFDRLQKSIHQIKL